MKEASMGKWKISGRQAKRARKKTIARDRKERKRLKAAGKPVPTTSGRDY